MSSTPPPIDPPSTDICKALCEMRDILADAYKQAENEEAKELIAEAQLIVDEQIKIHGCTC